MGKCLAQHLNIWIDSHWVPMMVQSWYLLMRLQMASLRFFICASPGSLDGLEVGYNEVTELRIYIGRDLGINLVTYDDTEIWL